MAKLSKHLSIYSSQYFSIASIIARVTIIGLVLGLPFLAKFGFFKNPLPYFVFVSLSIFILLYHIYHFIKKSLFSENGVIGLYLFINIGFLSINSSLVWDYGFFILLLFVFVYHTTLGVISIFRDYSYSSNSSIRFYNIYLFILMKSFLLVFYFIASIF